MGKRKNIKNFTLCNVTSECLNRIGMWVISVVFMTYVRRVSLMGSLFIKMSWVIGLCVSKFFDPRSLINPDRKDGDYTSVEGNVHISACISWELKVPLLKTGHSSAGARGVLFAFCLFVFV